MVSTRLCLTAALLLSVAVLTCSAELDSFEDAQEFIEPQEDDYDMVSRELEEEYEDQNFDAEDEEQYLLRREKEAYNWFENAVNKLAKIYVTYRVNSTRKSKPESRSIKTESKEAKSVIEKDTYIVDTDGNAVLAAIDRKDGKELTVLDYNSGVMAVLTPADKVCRLHEISEEDRNVNLEEEKEELESLSKSGRVVEATEDDDDSVDYRESSKAVDEKEVGDKIVQICTTKKYRMVWMESFDPEGEKRELTEDGFDAEEPSDGALESLDEDPEKRGCRELKVWHCAPVCTTTYTKKSYCCKRACLPNNKCVRTCYRNVRKRFCCKEKGCVNYYKRESYCCKKGCTPNKGRCIKTCYKKEAKKVCKKCCGWYYKKCCVC